MTYYGAKDLAASFRTVRKNTITIAEEIGESHYGFQAAPETRTVKETLVHIARICEIQEKVHDAPSGAHRLSTLVGLDFMSLVGPIIADEKTPRTKDEVLTLLRTSGERFGNWLEGLSDEVLGESVTMPPGMTPGSKSRFEMLLGVKEHEMHHRAQLMVLERLIGVTPHLTREFQARMAQMAAAAKP